MDEDQIYNLVEELADTREKLRKAEARLGQDQIDDLTIIIEDLTFRLADADRAASQALKDRDVYREQLSRIEFASPTSGPPSADERSAVYRELSRANAEIMRLTQFKTDWEEQEREIEYLVAKARYYKLKAKRPKDE